MLTTSYIVSGISLVAIVGMVLLHIEFRKSDPGYSPGDPPPWTKLKQRWLHSR